MNIKKLRNLFLSQSYLDTIRDYEEMLDKEKPSWDYVVLTASNESQAQTYRNEIDARLQEHSIPANCTYMVLADPDGKRVGSGGATLNVLKHIAMNEPASAEPFKNKKILVIHSGGDSKRVPQYSVCGKLFSPVPRETATGKTSTLFDEFLIVMASVARRISEGMLILSGDVLLLFNPLQLDLQFKGAAAISIKESVVIGKDHGVFLRGENNDVQKFLHKQSEETLWELGAVNEAGNVDLDTGAVLLDTDVMNDLYSLISKNGIYDEDCFHTFVNDRARISFYGDFLYPLAVEATLEDYYTQAPEGDMCEELLSCRTAIWEKLSKYRMKVFSLSPAEFIHFGTTTELLHLVSEDVANYAFLGWSSHVASNIETETDFAVNSSVILASSIGKGSYIENSFITDSTVGCGSIVSDLTVIGKTIPDGIVLHGVTLENDTCVVRVYGVPDNPKARLCKEATFLGHSIKEVLEHYHIEPSALWPDQEDYLWFANLYLPASDETVALENALLTYRIFRMEASAEEVEHWLNAERVSLYSSFNHADPDAVCGKKSELAKTIVQARFLGRINAGKNYKDALAVFDTNGIDEETIASLVDIAENSSLSLKIRIYYALARCRQIAKDQREKFMKKSFSSVSDAIYETTMRNMGTAFTYNIQKDYVKIELPVRVNWGGGWTDTPPYCLEHGGIVLNAALKLNGIAPIWVEIKKIQEKRIKVSSNDIGVEGYIDSVEELLDCSNPYDYFALHKAALIACGLVSLRGTNPTLEELLERLGGGFELSTQVIGVPKGSGLGTSSILSAACVKAIFEFFGRTATDAEIYRTVSCIEQLMSTGGGWQDQVGGVTPGIKFITSTPGLDQDIHVDYVTLSAETKKELNERFALIYTGQRRLARNLLRDVVGNYIGARQESVHALSEMKRMAVLMRFELEQGNVDGFAELLNKHWELSLQLDAGATNTCIDHIFLACEDYIDGKFIAGAGGGGFLQVVLKKGVTKDMLRERLNSVFQETGIDVWDCELV